ncbi:hypothetical protein [Actinosynnema sp. NPDC020468]|uniref:hypothetical protein n=1 Tax=Actinosynnema sp. NPDC020468 TaxID=3154488 RepID=UPI0033EACC08
MELLSLLGPLLASGVALFIATRGWKRQDQRDEEDRQHDKNIRQAALLAELLELSIAHGGMPTGGDAHRAKSILLQLPGHLGVILRPSLGLSHTMHVPLDKASAARLRPDEQQDAGLKWKIFDRASPISGQSFGERPDWIEAEIAYDIAGLTGGDQDAVLQALGRDHRDMNSIIRHDYQQLKGITSNSTDGA